MIINGHNLLQYSPIVGMLGKKTKHNGVSHGLSEAGYDIRIKQDVFFTYLPDAKGNYDMCVQVGNGEPTHGRFCLASAIEEFDMPSTLVGVVHDKSTWARQGLSVFNTVIEPMWHGFLTLELVYHGHHDLHIPAGTGIAQVLFSRLSTSAVYGGKYQGQADEPVGSKFESQ